MFEPGWPKREINYLKKAGIPFNVIAVVNHTSLDRAEELYNFFTTLGCRSLSINIEEQVGVNFNPIVGNDEAVQHFWQDLFNCWSKNKGM